MRLLKCLKNGGVKLTEYPLEHIPAYAILSHTWGTKDQEVTLSDFQQGRWRQKSGFQKIEFCRKQAAADMLDHFWVDTCCIDKSSSAELQEAITSMFLWYRKATKCYVYLSDVVASHDEQGETPPLATWKPSFRKSRWFTRGWTLQELLAPTCVEFFSHEGRKLGDRLSLGKILSEITNIAIEALKGADLSSFSIEHRLSWAENGETTRAEDKAYSLFGIFDVSMFVNYGEGGDKAMERLLREIGRPLGSLEIGRNGFEPEEMILESLNFLLRGDREEDIAPNAPRTFSWIFNSQTSSFSEWLKAERIQHKKETTGKGAVEAKSGLFWIKGKPGCGKSTLMKYIQAQPETKSLLEKWARGGDVLCASYYFCYKGSKLQKSQEGMLRSLLYACLARRRELIEVVTEDLSRRRSDELSEYWNLRRLKGTLKKVISYCESRQTPKTGHSNLKFCFFIDGLDEYEGDHEELAEFILEIAGLPQVKLCVSSRPLNAFERRFEPTHSPNIVLQKLTSSDIRKYVEGRFDNCPQMNRILVRPRLTSNITHKASGVFVWVVLVVKLLIDAAKNGYSDYDLERHLDSYPDEIDQLYKLIIGKVSNNELKHCFRYLRLVEVNGGTISLMLLTVADMLLDGLPPTPESFNRTIQLESARLRINSSCLGLLEIERKRDDRDEELTAATVVFLHKSVFDYLKTDGAQKQFKNFEAVSFLPEKHLIDATLLLLKIRYPKPKAMTRPVWFSAVRPHAMNFLRLARAMEEKTGRCESECVDQLNRQVTGLWEMVSPRLPEEENGDIHWARATLHTRNMAAYLAETAQPIEPMPSNRPPRHKMHSFIRFANEFGLHLYAKEKGISDKAAKNTSQDGLSKAEQITNKSMDPQAAAYLPRAAKLPPPDTTDDVVYNVRNTRSSYYRQPQYHTNLATPIVLDDRGQPVKVEVTVNVSSGEANQSRRVSKTSSRNNSTRRQRHDYEAASSSSTAIDSRRSATTKSHHPDREKRKQHSSRGHSSRHDKPSKSSHHRPEQSTASQGGCCECVIL